MWERMMDAGLLVAGAVALFVVFTAILFVYERREEKKPIRRRPPLRVLRCDNHPTGAYVGGGPGKSDRAA
jgi:hypothetical protein